MKSNKLPRHSRPPVLAFLLADERQHLLAEPRNAGSSVMSRLRSAGRCGADRDIAEHPGRPGGKDDDAVGEEHRLVDVVGDEDDGLALGLPQRQQLELQPLAGQRVERAERLVHEQDERVGGQRAGDRHALAHAARDAVGR